MIDCSPSLGTLTINAFACANSVIIPTQSEYLSSSSTTNLISSILKTKRDINPNLSVEGILITMTDDRTTAYIFLFILTAALIIDTAMIAVSIAAYAISGNAANLENITTYALIISFASTVNVYLIKKIMK